MSEMQTALSSHDMLDTPRPWPFSRAELTAALRRKIGDPSLTITELYETEMPQRRPAIGRIRSLQVRTHGRTGKHKIDLVVKEPQGSTRAGMAGAGLREVSVYKTLGDHLPIRTPLLLTADTTGAWLIFNQLSAGRLPEQWKAADYLLATDQLAVLHDRFWGLGEDLTIYRWLRRPLDTDFSIHIQAAQLGISKLENRVPPSILSQDINLQHLLEQLIAHAENISTRLNQEATTLLHGDYWPGNIHVHSDGSLTLYDWEEASIGPAILDVVAFVQYSRWWFEPLPLAADTLIDHYRERIERANGHTWTADEWEELWDYALMWVFLTRWVDMLATIPDTILEARLGQLESVWLHPVSAMIKRHLRNG
jgi:hypothetical protein